MKLLGLRLFSAGIRVALGISEERLMALPVETVESWRMSAEQK